MFDCYSSIIVRSLHSIIENKENYSRRVKPTDYRFRQIKTYNRICITAIYFGTFMTQPLCKGKRVSVHQICNFQFFTKIKSSIFTPYRQLWSVTMSDKRT